MCISNCRFGLWFLVFSATFNNISVISYWWRNPEYRRKPPAIVLSVFMFTIILGRVWSVWMEVNLCIFCIHVLSLEIQVSGDEAWDSINRFNHIFVSIPNQDLDLQAHMPGSLCVQWVQLKWEFIVLFVDISGIDDHHCLNFLIKITIV